MGIRAGHAQDLSRGLGWLSICLGLAEVLAPRPIARGLGMRGRETLLSGYGLREIATGVAILSSGNPRPWIWGRVAGDVLDIVTLSDGLRRDNPQRGVVKGALLTVGIITAVDVLSARLLGRKQTAERARHFDYSDRSGLPHSPMAMRGAARDAEIPRDMRAPEPMRPYAH